MITKPNFKDYYALDYNKGLEDYKDALESYCYTVEIALDILAKEWAESTFSFKNTDLPEEVFNEVIKTTKMALKNHALEEATEKEIWD